MDIKTTAKLTLNHENIFGKIEFLIYIHEIPVKFAIFETQFAKVSSLEMISRENIFSLGIINLTNDKGSNVQKHRKRYLIFTFSTCYFYAIHCNNVSE